MARSASRTPAFAILGVAGCAIFHQLQHGAFVSPLSALSTSSHRLDSSVTLAATKAEVMEAEKQVKLLTWAYETALAQEMPQAAAAKARADQAVAKLQALKAPAEEGPAPPAPVSSMLVSSSPVAAPAIAPAAPTSVNKAEIAEAEKRAKLLTWAYETAVAQGMPQAASAKARADQAVAHLQALKAQAEGSPALSSSTSPAPVSAPSVAEPAPVAAVPAKAPEARSGTKKLRVWVAEKRAKLFMWAATTAADKGIPQAAMIKAKADQVVAAFEALKEQAAPKNMVLG